MIKSVYYDGDIGEDVGMTVIINSRPLVIISIPLTTIMSFFLFRKGAHSFSSAFSNSITLRSRLAIRIDVICHHPLDEELKDE